MTTMTFRARRRDTAITAALAAAPLYRGRILRGLARCLARNDRAAARLALSASVVGR